MNLRIYLLIRACLFGIIAVFLAGLPLFTKVDTRGLWLGMGMAAFFGLMSYFYFRKVARTRAQERAFAPPADASVAQQISYYRRILIAGCLGFIVVTVATVIDLNALESGREKSVTLWAPLTALYEAGGYWVTVLSLPAFGLLVCGSLFFKIRKLKGTSR